MSDLRTIKVKNFSDVNEEIQAAGAITPGMLLALNSSGYVIAHNAAGQNALPMFACEDELQGNGVDDAYASGDKVAVWIPNRGDVVQAILADGENVNIGDYLESNGAGYLQKHVADKESFESAETGSITVYPNQIVGQVLEAKDLSGSSGEDSEDSGGVGYNRRVKVRII